MRRVFLLIALAGCEKAAPSDYAIGWDMFQPGDRYEVAWTLSVDGAMVAHAARTARLEVLAVDGDRTSKERLEILSDEQPTPVLGTFELSAPSADGPLSITKLGGELTADERRDLEHWQQPVMTLMPRQKPFFTHRFVLGQSYKVVGADADALGYRAFDDGATFTLVGADDKQLRFTIAAKATHARDGVRPELVGHAEYSLDRGRTIHRVIDIVYYDTQNRPAYRVHQDSRQRRLLKQTASR